MTNRILVSACLLGRKVRYDGRAKLTGHDTLTRWEAEQRVVAFCPEIASGFAVPRAPAEINQGDGPGVLAGRARVLEESGRDVTAAFIKGAQHTLDAALQHGCRFALLTNGSPSCGSSFIYDGSFTGAAKTGQGVTAALLAANGIQVFAEDQIEALNDLLGPS